MGDQIKILAIKKINVLTKILMNRMVKVMDQTPFTWLFNDPKEGSTEGFTEKKVLDTNNVFFRFSSVLSYTKFFKR
jgi:hypothetical protein